MFYLLLYWHFKQLMHLIIYYLYKKLQGIFACFNLLVINNILNKPLLNVLTCMVCGQTIWMVPGHQIVQLKNMMNHKSIQVWWATLVKIGLDYILIQKYLELMNGKNTEPVMSNKFPNYKILKVDSYKLKYNQNKMIILPRLCKSDKNMILLI